MITFNEVDEANKQGQELAQEKNPTTKKGREGWP